MLIKEQRSIARDFRWLKSAHAKLLKRRQFVFWKINTFRVRSSNELYLFCSVANFVFSFSVVKWANIFPKKLKLNKRYTQILIFFKKMYFTKTTMWTHFFLFWDASKWISSVLKVQNYSTNICYMMKQLAESFTYLVNTVDSCSPMSFVWTQLFSNTGRNEYSRCLAASAIN